jgi:hypothetical protein
MPKTTNPMIVALIERILIERMKSCITASLALATAASHRADLSSAVLAFTRSSVFGTRLCPCCDTFTRPRRKIFGKFPRLKPRLNGNFSLGSFWSDLKIDFVSGILDGAPEEIRTPDPQIRSLRVGGSADNAPTP